MTRSVQVRVVVITGAGQGLGRAYAQRVAHDGAFLLSDDSRSVTGQTLHVNGGILHR